MGNRFFVRMHKTSKAKTKHLGVTAFRQQCELYLSVLDDALIHDHYVKMFVINGCTSVEDDEARDQPTEDDMLLINPDGLGDMLMTCFRIAIHNYVSSSGSGNDCDMSLPTETYCPYVSSNR